jgi:predicted metalloenzyme YecM
MSLLKIQLAAPAFIAAVVERCETLHGIDVRPYQADHVCWRCETVKEYLLVCADMKASGAERLAEGMIGGRPISTFRLAQPLCATLKDGTAFEVECVEVPCPKPGRFYASGLEHVEFVVGDPVLGEGVQGTAALERFRRAVGDVVEFDERAFTKDINPDISLKLGEMNGRLVSCKFHSRPLSEVCAFEADPRNGFVGHDVPSGYFSARSSDIPHA